MAYKFFKICEREILDAVNDGLELHVIQEGKGLDIDPEIQLTKTPLNKDTGKTNDAYNHFQYNGYFGFIFTIDVEVRRSERYNGKAVIDYLYNLYVNARQVYVRTRGFVPNGKYLITKMSGKQEFKDSIVFSMEFTTYRSLKAVQYKNNNMSIAQAKKNAKSKNKKSSSSNKALGKCKVSEMKLKKKNNCCFQLNRKLLKLGYLSSKTWKTMTKKKETNAFTKDTANALKKFQKKYKVTDKNLAHHLIVSGKMDSKTLTALTKV